VLALLACLAVLAWWLLPDRGAKGSWSSYARKQQDQQEHKTALESLGATFTEVEIPHWGGRSWSVGLRGLKITDEVLNHLNKLELVTDLDLSRSTLTDTQLEVLCQGNIGSTLRNLNLSGTKVTDKGLDQLTDLFFLNDLNLTGTQITAAGVKRFQKNRENNPRLQTPLNKKVTIHHP
jgi:hypothetical protein